MGRECVYCIAQNFQLPEKKVSHAAAIKFREKVFLAVETLLEHPERYSFDRLLLEEPPRYRAIPVNGYRIVYEIKNNAIFILLIYHQRQNPEKIKKSMP